MRVAQPFVGVTAVLIIALSNWCIAAPSTQPAAEVQAKLVIENGKQRLEVTCPAIRQYCLKLLTVDAYRGKQFLGTHQRFEEASAVETFSMMMPALADADRLVVRFQAFAIDEAEIKKREGWYAHAWTHFTTAQQSPNGWKWLLVRAPISRDLAFWMEQSGLHPTSLIDGTREVRGVQGR